MSAPKCDKPLLIFSLPLDSERNVIPGLNRGRLVLVDYDRGFIQRWVFTSSYEQLQKVSDWEVTGGVIPPNFAMNGFEWFKVPTKLIVQPGQPVDEGYLVLYNGSNTFTTINGNIRSEVMFHCDKNYKSAPGSRGCLVALPDEWEDFKQVFKEACGHLSDVKLAVIYTY